MLKIKDLLFRLDIKRQILMGYIDKDFAPKKCRFCKCKRFHKGINTYEDICGCPTEVEYELICDNCNKRVGIWSYGSWCL